MAEKPGSERTLAPPSGLRRVRTALADAGVAARGTLGRLRGTKRSDVAQRQAPEPTSAADEVQASPKDLADADVAVRRAWSHLRLVIVIVATLAPVVVALISWRISVWRAQRR